LDIFAEDIELHIDLTLDSERAKIGHSPSVWDDRYGEMIIICCDDREAHSIECYAAFFDDQMAILWIKVDSDEIRAITVLSDCTDRPNGIDMPCDEVSIDAGLGSDTALDIELISDLFTAKIGPRQTLLHSKKCIR
jgi:hypothetical protein